MRQHSGSDDLLKDIQASVIQPNALEISVHAAISVLVFPVSGHAVKDRPSISSQFFNVFCYDAYNLLRAGFAK